MLVKFLTLNLFEGGLLFDNIEKFLIKEKPDIMTFQEVYDGHGDNLPRNFRSLDELQKILPGYNYHFAPLFNQKTQYGGIKQGLAVFSKFPIIESKLTFFDIPYDPKFIEEDKKGDYSKDPQGVLHTKININSIDINVFDIHGIWGFDGVDNERRIEMAQTVLKEIGDLNKVILAGDFNVRPDTQTITMIEKRLKNVFKNELSSTFNMKHKDIQSGYAKSVVDMIFVSNDIQILDKQCFDIDVSDHLPLKATFEID